MKSVFTILQLAIVLTFCNGLTVQDSVLVAQEADTQSPNIILIMADDLGWGDTSYNGHPVLKTPGLDAMAKNGLRFNRFYAAAPVCSPTRGSCLTGRHPFRYGVYFANTGHLPNEELTLAEYLKSRGYVTGHFGKWHLGTLTKTVRDSNRGGPKNKQHFAPPWKHGFDESFSTEAKVPTFDPLLKPQKASKNYWLPVQDKSQANPYGTRYWHNGIEVKDELLGDDSKIIMDRAINFIKNSKSQKFLSVIWFHAPHLPVVASQEDRSAFRNQSPYAQSYFGSIKALDREVNRLRRTLQNLKIADNTLVCFCSDNGPEGNSKAPGSAGDLRGRKRSLYEGGIRVPGIIEWPAVISPNTETDFAAVTSDYLPTILDLTGGSSQVPLDGVSLKSVLYGKSTRRTQPIYFESKKTVAVIGQQFKLVAQTHPQPDKLGSIELYDLIADPSESTNIVDSKPELVKSLIRGLQQWRQNCRASHAGQDYESSK